jgi:hypothetical protein
MSRMTKELALQWLFDFGSGWVSLQDLRRTWANDIKIIEWSLCINEGTMEKRIGGGEFEFRINQKAIKLLEE